MKKQKKDQKSNKKEQIQEQKPNWVKAIIILVLIYLLSSIVASFFSGSGEMKTFGNTALIKINAPITAEAVSVLGERSVGSDEIIRFIDSAEKNPSIKAVIFEINSPGGTAVASSEIMNRIKKLNKTKVSYIRELGVSGAYWVASATEHIIANSMSILGSIGVFSSYLDFSGFLQNYNITYQRLVGGKYKDIGTPLKQLTDSERRILQQNIDELHDMFLQSVRQNRHLNEETANELKKALIYNGEEAYLIGLVDEIGGKQEAINYVEDKLNIKVQIAVYKKTQTLLDKLRSLSSNFGFSLGTGISSGIFESQNNARIYS